MLEIKLQINKDSDIIRLDKFLKNKYTDYTRIEIKKAISEGLVKVNDCEIKPSYKLRISDLVTGKLHKLPEILLKPNKEVPIKIVYEDDSLICINKDSGYPVYPSKHHEYDTIANGLLARFPFLKKEFYGSIRVGIIHRLDKETSGALLVAKKRQVFYNISKLFETRKIKKVYLALVYGNLENKEGYIDVALTRSKKDFRKRIIVSEGNSLNSASKYKEAITFYKVLRSFNGYDLIEAYPKTGRMHQIRAHFLYLGHSVLGDKLYQKLDKINPIKAPRLMLHSYKIEFDYNNKEYKIEVPLPSDFDDFLK